ncbi:uncharacterized protein LOC144872210 isoform X2 [Branchiostoma floridae x Branchiostoma japonicum]
MRLLLLHACIAIVLVGNSDAWFFFKQAEKKGTAPKRVDDKAETSRDAGDEPIVRSVHPFVNAPMQPPRLPYPAIPAMRHPASQPGHPIGPRAPVPNHPAKRPLQPKGPKISIPAEHVILPPAPKAPGKPAESLILPPVPHQPAGPLSPGKAPSPATKGKKKAPYRYLYCPEKCTEIEGNIYE